MKKLVYPKKFKEFCVKKCHRHAFNLGVKHWDVSFNFKQKPKEDHECDSIVAADCVTNRRYLTATINIYPCTLEEWTLGNKRRVEDIVAHELSHLVTQHVWELITAVYKDEGESKDAWEQVTEIISRLSCTIEKLELKLTKKR